jgi:hypothetical protein
MDKLIKEVLTNELGREVVYLSAFMALVIDTGRSW